MVYKNLLMTPVYCQKVDRTKLFPWGMFCLTGNPCPMQWTNSFFYIFWSFFFVCSTDEAHSKLDKIKMIAQPIKISISLSSREPISFFNMSGTSSVVWLSNRHRSWHDSCPNFTSKQVHTTEMMQDTIRERVTRSRIVARALAKRRILPTSLWWNDFCVQSITSATDVVASINRAAKTADMTLMWVSNGETGISLGFGCLTCPQAGQKWHAALRCCHHNKIKIT